MTVESFRRSALRFLHTLLRGNDTATVILAAAWFFKPRWEPAYPSCSNRVRISGIKAEVPRFTRSVLLHEYAATCRALIACRYSNENGADFMTTRKGF